MFDEATAIDTLFISQVVDNCVNATAAQINTTFFAFSTSVAGNQDVARWVRFQGSSNASEDSFVVRCYFGRRAFERN